MGLISGSGSFTRYWVDGTLPSNLMEELPEKIARYAFKSLDENSFEEHSMGWVNIMDILDNRFMAMEYLKEPFIAMSFRVDKRKVPQTALKQQCVDAEEKIKARDNLEFLPKTIRQEIKENARNLLLKRAIPDTKAYDMIWDTNSGVLIFGSVNNKLCDEFAEFFLKTFNLHLQPIFPYALAGRFLEKERGSTDALDSLLSINPSEKNRQVLEKVKETASLGREFLAWLWYKTENDQGIFDLGEHGKAELWFDGKMTLQAEYDLGVETITCTGDSLHMKEARFALYEKKEITLAMVRLSIGDNLWNFIVDSTWMNYKSFKTPKVIQDKEDDPEGIFYEKTFLMQEAITAIDIIFSSFIKLLISPEWGEKEHPALVNWINKIK